MVNAFKGIMTEVATFIDSFLAATDVPIVKPIVWPDSILAEHPLRKQKLFVRFWPVSVRAYIDAAADAQKNLEVKERTWGRDTFYYAIAATVCDASGVPVFNHLWSKIYTEIAEWDANMSITKDENGVLVVPRIPDYELIGKWLAKKYDSEQGAVIMGPLWDQSMNYNGLISGADLKNSEATNGSKPTTEQL